MKRKTVMGIALAIVALVIIYFNFLVPKSERVNNNLFGISFTVPYRIGEAEGSGEPVVFHYRAESIYSLSGREDLREVTVTRLDFNEEQWDDYKKINTDSKSFTIMTRKDWEMFVYPLQVGQYEAMLRNTRTEDCWQMTFTDLTFEEIKAVLESVSTIVTN